MVNVTTNYSMALEISVPREEETREEQIERGKICAILALCDAMDELISK